jgi:hypothetical protein
VPLQVEAGQAGDYTLTASQLRNFPAATDVLLRDAQTGTLTNLHQVPGYSFALAGPTTGGRFSLLFRPGTVAGTGAGARAAAVGLYPNPARDAFTLLIPALGTAQTLEATLYNSLGQPVQQHRLRLGAAGGPAEIKIGQLPAGVYSLQLRAPGLRVTKRLILQ